MNFQSAYRIKALIFEVNIAPFDFKEYDESVRHDNTEQSRNE